MNKFKVGDLVQCINSLGVQLNSGQIYTVLDSDGYTIKICNSVGMIVDYFNSRFELYRPAPKQEETMDIKSVEQCIKEFLKRLEYVLYHDVTVASMLDVNVEGDLYLEGDITTIYGVDDIYTYVNNSYDQLTSQAAQKRKQELLDKKAKLDVELSQINKELEGL